MKKIFQGFMGLSLLAFFAFASIHSGGGHWKVLNGKHDIAGRSECGMAAVNGKLYLMGGDDTAVESFDPATLTWTKKAKSPVAMNHIQPVAFQNKVYVLEAFSEGGFPNQKSMANVMIYDTEKDSWKKGGVMPEDRRRAAAGAAEYHGKLYLVAGIQHGHSSGTNAMFDVYDPKTDRWTALADAPHIRDHCAAAVIQDKLYAVGGRNTSYHEADNFMAFMSHTVLEVDYYDFKTGKWSTLSAKLPLGSGGGSMVNMNDKLYYIGGERATETEQNRPRKSSFCFDPAAPDHWTETDSLNTGRNGMSAAVIKDKIYVFGGAGSPPPNGMPGGPPAKSGKPWGPPKGASKPSALEVFSAK